jgi:integrase
MPGHVQDRWIKTETGPDGQLTKLKTDRYGKGLRYRARYLMPDGAERSRSFPDKQKRKAEAWLSQIEADLTRGQYSDPSAGNVAFKQYATEWLKSQTTNASSIEATELRLRLHAFPYIGHRPMHSFLPLHIRQWVRALQDSGMAGSYQRTVFANVSAVFTAAVDDGVIVRNPCRAGSVRVPRPDPRKVRPWPTGRVFAVRAAMPREYQATVDVGAGCGLRQGEIFGLAVDEVDFLGGVIHVVRQVKIVSAKLVFAPPKGDKLRDIPLSDSVAFSLAGHITRRPPTEITLPWKTPAGPPVTAPLLFYTRERKALNRNYFNSFIWKPALMAAGLFGIRWV